MAVIWKVSRRIYTDRNLWTVGSYGQIFKWMVQTIWRSVCTGKHSGSENCAPKKYWFTVCFPTKRGGTFSAAKWVGHYRNPGTCSYNLCAASAWPIWAKPSLPHTKNSKIKPILPCIPQARVHHLWEARPRASASNSKNLRGESQANRGWAHSTKTDGTRIYRL